MPIKTNPISALSNLPIVFLLFEIRTTRKRKDYNNLKLDWQVFCGFIPTPIMFYGLLWLILMKVWVRGFILEMGRQGWRPQSFVLVFLPKYRKGEGWSSPHNYSKSVPGGRQA